MKQEEITQNNKLIAEFMGYPKPTARSYWDYDGSLCKSPYQTKITVKAVTDSMIQFVEPMAYEWYAIEYFEDGKTFVPHGTNFQTHLPSNRYHLSWDWLMPVVEKIESLWTEVDGHFGVYICSNGCTIQGTKFQSDTEPYSYFLQMDGQTKIEATYNAVCAFIEWHNQQHSPAIVDRSEKPGGTAEDL